MRAVTWQGRRNVRVDDVPDPAIRGAGDAVVRVRATGLCGSDLHLYEHLLPGLDRGDVLGHEAVGVVEQVGDEVRRVALGDHVAIAPYVSCGTCWMCTHGLPSQCETTQNTAFHRGASLHGYTEIYGDVPGCQAELVHVPFADANLHRLPDGAHPVRAVLTTDVLPTAWQGVVSADLEPGATVGVFGLGPIGQAAARIAAVTAGARVIGVDHVPERLVMAERHGVETIDRGRTSDVPGAIVERTDGRGVDAVIDCVGMEADGSSLDSVLQATRVQPSRVIALRHAIDAVRRGGTLSVLGLYAGPIHGFPFEQVFDKSLTIRTGQVNVARWFDDVARLAFAPDDPLALDDLVTHVVPMRVAPAAYQRFQRKRDGIVKLVFLPEEQAA